MTELSRFPEVPASPNFPEIEEKVIASWNEAGTFQKSIDANAANDEFVFYDGPPFANGLPHYGHLLTGYVKDVVPRFQTMLGKKVDRVFGWDTHGLPAELEAQKELGISTPDEIKELGIAKFNEACRKSVLKYTEVWEDYINRQARWVDFERGYKTLDLTYMESCLWAFKQLYDKSLAYKGYKVLPYCWNDETPLSNHELRMDDDVYQDKTDNTVTVGVRLLSGEIALVWTTTPWTLPTNFAIAAGPDIEYVYVRPTAGDWAGETLILAAARLDAFAKELGSSESDFEIVKAVQGHELKGLKYHPMFDYFGTHDAVRNIALTDNLDNAWQIANADYVSTENGTGLVHIAPYGEDDMLVLGALGVIPPVPMTEAAVLTDEISDYKGLHVFEANKPITADLRNGTGSVLRLESAVRPILFREQSMTHSYPHCWRCRKPLIYKPVSSWFVKVSAIKDRLLELNQEINWIPDNVKDGQFGKWLENARDWAISRNRFWGTPIPVWVSDNPEFPRVDVYGSLAELEADFGVPVTDLHRPFIDSLVRANPDDPSGQSKMVRIEDVFDCWFESGSMPFAQVHYPFENKDWFESHFPADFIVEYIGQTRGWFYLTHVMGVALFDSPAFKNVICHGIVLGSDGAKMSKSLKNYPDVYEVFNRDGSDAMRWFLISGSILKGGNLVVTEEAIRDATRQVLLPLWSTYYFFTLYANASNDGAGIKLAEIDHAQLDVSDKYILSKTRVLISSVQSSLEDLAISDACESVRVFLDVLTNWYIRTNRARFWAEDTTAFSVLYTVLEAVCRTIAPLAPMVSEEIWRGLTGGRAGSESVHLAAFPSDFAFEVDESLNAKIDAIREIISSGLSLRSANDQRVRQPLASLMVAADNPAAVNEFGDILASELNVKEVRVVDGASVSREDFGIVQKLDVNARALGPRIGKEVQKVIGAAKAGAWKLVDDVVVVDVDGAPFELLAAEYELNTAVNSEGSAAAVLSSGDFIVLDLNLTPALIAEGTARDVVRKIQDARKAQGFEVSDRVQVSITTDADTILAISDFEELIKHETLADSIVVDPTLDKKAHKILISK